MASDLNSVLKKYLETLGKNEASAAEVVKSVRSWVVENGEIAKEKIEKQIEETVSRMGFVKVSDLDILAKRISELEGRAKTVKKSTIRTVKKKSVAKKTISKKSAPKDVKAKSTSKKGRK
jgi:polyhydroxyalkanoate synthesis regulator phasin